MAHSFVAFRDDGGKTYLYKADKKKKFRQVLWGDFLKIDGEEPGGWLRIIWAPNDPEKRETVYIRKEDTVDRRPLEIIFLDVGQGDGAVMISPETGANERITVIDAGEGDHMVRFLNGRFKAYRGFSFDAAILTHPDKDHYLGFREIFENKKIGFKTVYHNGLVERPVSGTFEKLGGVKKDNSTGVSYVQDLAVSRADVKKHFSDADDFGSYEFPPVMHAALNNPKIKDIRMLSASHGQIEDGICYMPGYAPSNNRGYTIEVLGPVAEFDAANKPRLRRLGSYGETKNGHSVILRLQYGDFSILFGGDLNEPAEKFLIRHYADVERFPQAGTPAYREMVAKASRRLRSEVMKSCHHGSEKVTDAFLEAVNPAAFVISSGDEEGHVHPRPDLLGRLGLFGRGGAPVILSTELQRSTREREDEKLIDKINKNIDKLAAAPSAALGETLKEQIAELGKTNVSVYGAIYVKTDGRRLMTAFKIETGSDTKKWFYFEYKILESGELVRM
jgi:beta-lactamase superfamily II metal-dependent hydrolase